MGAEATISPRVYQLEMEGNGVWIPTSMATNPAAAVLMGDPKVVRRLRAGDYVSTEVRGERTRWRFKFLRFEEQR